MKIPDVFYYKPLDKLTDEEYLATKRRIKELLKTLFFCVLILVSLPFV